MSRAWRIQLGSVGIVPRKNHPGDFDPELIDRDKLAEATRLAKRLSDVAFLTLMQFRRGELPPDARREVQYTLAKYFCIHPLDDEYEEFVGGIIRVYMNIVKGIMSPYEITIFDPTDARAVSQARGYVRPTRANVRRGVQTSSASPVQKLFHLSDDWHHRPWEGYFTTGRIHLSLALVIVPAPPVDHVARTIVHEASHKYAGTTDVLYKHRSFNKLTRREFDLAVSRHVRVGLPMPGGKTVFPMTGLDRSGNDMISPERFIENADSYAWAARRIWKRLN